MGLTHWEQRILPVCKCYVTKQALGVDSHSFWWRYPLNLHFEPCLVLPTARWSKRGYRSSRSRFKTNRDRDRSLYWVETVIKQMTTYMSHSFCFWKVQRKLSALEFSHFARENDYSELFCRNGLFWCNYTSAVSHSELFTVIEKILQRKRYGKSRHKIRGNTRLSARVSTALLVFLNFHSWFYHSIDTVHVFSVLYCCKSIFRCFQLVER